MHRIKQLFLIIGMAECAVSMLGWMCILNGLRAWVCVWEHKYMCIFLISTTKPEGIQHSYGVQ